MPIRPENKARYPKDWKAISLNVRESSGWKCEFCLAEHGKPHPVTGSKVILTVAHLDHTPENCERSNLKALCQKCHNSYDAPMRRAGIKKRAFEAKAIGCMFQESQPATGLEQPPVITKLKRCIKSMLEAEKALRPLHPDKADELKGAAGIAEEWVEHISGETE